MSENSASEQIDEIIAAYPGWKGDLLKQIREVVTKADPSIYEEVKWKMRTRPAGLPVWSSNGIVCFAEIWKGNIKLLFPHGAQLKDTNNLFNSRLQSKDIRAIEFKEDSKVNVSSLRALLSEAVVANSSRQ
jgi:hypothetical protein